MKIIEAIQEAYGPGVHHAGRRHQLVERAEGMARILPLS